MHAVPIKLILVLILTGPVKRLLMHVEAYIVLRHDGAVRKGRGDLSSASGQRSAAKFKQFKKENTVARCSHTVFRFTIKR